MTFVFYGQIFSKNTQIRNFIKIVPVGTILLHAGGQTDRHDEAVTRLITLAYHFDPAKHFPQSLRL